MSARAVVYDLNVRSTHLLRSVRSPIYPCDLRDHLFGVVIDLVQLIWRSVLVVDMISADPSPTRCMAMLFVGPRVESRPSLSIRPTSHAPYYLHSLQFAG